MRNIITSVFDLEDVDRWREAVSTFRSNRYQARALQGFLEEAEYLVETCEALDKFRETLPTSETGQQLPSESQRLALYKLTKSYFDKFYGCLSHLASVIVRHADVFGQVSLSENRAVVRWLGANCPSCGHNGQAELERARLFRAIVNHPQQFPTFDWITATAPDHGPAHVVLHGPASRSGKIPPGSTRGSPIVGGPVDWAMEAPDEVSVTNSLFSAAGDCLRKVAEAHMAGTAFRSKESREAAAISALFPEVPAAEKRIRVTPEGLIGEIKPTRRHP